MTWSASLRRLLVAACVFGACLGVSEGRNAAHMAWSASAWAWLDGSVQSTPGSLAADIDGDGDLDRLAVDHALTTDTVWGGEHAGGLALFQILVPQGLPAGLHSQLNFASSDDSDSSDPSVRTESRAGPSVAQPAGAVLTITPVTPRSRTFSSSTPRAPPVVIRTA